MKYRVPDWYRNAKLGIMIHWGPSAVPAYAPTEHGDITDILREHDWPWYFHHSPYAEWYANGLRLPDSDVRAYHNAHFGRHVAYERFARRFNDAARDWDPGEWADFFAELGARYVVMVSKHHDGYLMWPSESRKADSFVADRDLVGLTADAVRERELRFGVYYSGQLDWTYQTEPIRDFSDLLLAEVSDEYAAHAERHFNEIIERYRPDLLWNDIGLPSQISAGRLFRTYRKTVPDGVLNDRWRQLGSGLGRKIAGTGIVTKRIAEKARQSILDGIPGGGPGDVATAEYGVPRGILQKPWELVRGLGRSFGYNQEESEEMTMSGTALIRLLVDVVSRNGNLLINVGPDVHGDIPAVQRKPLAELGSWLSVHGQAIFGTRPWKRAEAQTPDGVPLRFTSRENTLYVIALETPPMLQLTIPDLTPSDILSRGNGSADLEFEISLLGSEREVEWSVSGGSLTVSLPGSFRPTGAVVIRLAWLEPKREPDRFYTDII